MAGAWISKKGTRKLFCHQMWPGFLCLALLPSTLSSAAPRFDSSQQPLGSVAPLSLTGTDLSTGDVKAYRTWFENGDWQGDLIEYEVSTQGTLSTAIDLTGVSPTDPGGLPDTWSAHVQFAVAEAGNATYWDTGRNIITRIGTSQVAFRWGNLPDAMKASLDQLAFDASGASSDVLDFVRGKRADEFPNGSLRPRASVLGDLIHSNPVYVAKPGAGFNTNGYATFVANNATRAQRIYVGANDGMLHVFDAATGDEVWAYIPSMLIPRLAQLAARPYGHQYYVDGLLTVQDTYFGNNWHTVLVGGLGAGGQGWFGLDITHPSLSGEATSITIPNANNNNAKILWELDSSGDDDLGDAFGQAVISKLNDGNWYAVFGNGYNSVSGLAKLYLVNVATGSVVKRISTNSGSAASPNGLSSPTLVDTNGDGKADIVYAGDIDGNMWKFDLTSDSSANWGVAYSGTPIHTGLATQPVIQPPDVSRHPVAGHLVLFGTGHLFTSSDLSDLSVQALYGIWDSGLTPPNANDQSLLAQTLSGDLAYTSGAFSEVVQTIDPDPGVIDWSSDDGWKLELPVGFRVLQPPQLRAGRLKVTISNPVTRANYLLEPNYLDGGSPGQPIFDLDRSAFLTVADNVDGNGDGDLGDREDVPVMWARPTGIMSQPAIARVSDGVDAQLLNFLLPPPGLPCEGICPDGFKGGNIDLTTDYFGDPNGGTGGETFKYTARYDKEVGRVYADYLDLIVTGHAAVNGHVELNNPAFIDGDQQFIVVVANADRSPGSTLTLGTTKYNIVEYQALIHRKLNVWNGTDPLTDDAGNSLIFTANGLVSSGGTVRNSFNDQSILTGGLHATNPKCVIPIPATDPIVTNGRYRSGVLVIQAINRDIFPGTGSNMLDELIVQNPPDLQSPVILRDGSQVNLKPDLNNDGNPGDPAAYEVLGGLRAKNTGPGVSDGLWESTVFWNWGERTCYATGDYEQLLATRIDALTFSQQEFEAELAALAIVDLTAEIIANQDCRDILEDDGGCLAYFQTLLELLAKEATIFYDGQVVDNTGLESNRNAPVVMGGAASGQGVSTGPNFRTGRRTWVDLVAD